jgi:hypothetical protein
MWEPKPRSPAAIRAKRYRDRKKGREKALSNELWKERFAHLDTKRELAALRERIVERAAGE